MSPPPNTAALGGTVDAVLLDAGGVLLLPDPDAMRRALAPFGVDASDETCHRAHYASMREIDRIGRLDWVAADRVLARVSGVAEASIEDAIGAIEQVYLGNDWVPVPGAAEALIRLQEAGIPLAVVSNAEGTMEQQLATHQICSTDGQQCARVALVVDSTVVGVEKPDPAIFDFALEALGAAPERCLYLGDTVHFDVNGARAAGLRPVHVDPFDLCDADDHPHLPSVAALADTLSA